MLICVIDYQLTLRITIWSGESWRGIITTHRALNSFAFVNVLFWR